MAMSYRRLNLGLRSEQPISTMLIRREFAPGMARLSSSSPTLPDVVVAERVRTLFSKYRPLAGSYDELMDDHGAPRAHAVPLFRMFSGFSPEELGRFQGLA